MDNGHRSRVTQLAELVMILLAWIVGWGFMFGGAMGGGATGSLFAGAGMAIIAGGTLMGLRVAFQLNDRAFRLAAAALLLALVLVFAAVLTS